MPRSVLAAAAGLAARRSVCSPLLRLCLSAAALFLLGDASPASAAAAASPSPKGAEEDAARLRGKPPREQREAEDRPGLVADCDVDVAEEESVSLLQTGMAGVGAAAQGLQQQQQQQQQQQSAGDAAVADLRAAQAAAVAAADRHSHITATGRRVWTVKEQPVSHTFLYVLPVIGFALAMAAIVGTVLLEKGWPGGKLGDPIGFSASPRGVLDARVPRSASPRMDPPALFSGVGAGGGAAEGLLRGAGGFGSPQRNDHLFHRPQMPPSAPKTVPPPGRPQGAAPPPPTTQPPQGVPGPPLAPTFPGSPEVHVVVPFVPQGGYLGLNLSEADLTVTGFALPTARGYGFLVGDRILAINGMAVNHQDDFVYWLDVAMMRNQSHGEPLDFTVWRQQQPPQQSHVPTTAGQLEGAPSSPMGTWIGTWEYTDETSNRYTYAVVRGGDGQLLFEQRLPDGEVASGVLRPTGRDDLEADLLVSGGRPHGTVLLKHSPDGASIRSKLRRHGEHSWGKEIEAFKASALPGSPALRPPAGVSVNM